MTKQGIFLVAGLADATHVAALQRDVASFERQVTMALSVPEASRMTLETSCVDLTAHVAAEDVVSACRRWVSSGMLVLVRDHQLGMPSVVDVMNDLGLRAVVLDGTVSYDTDPSWVVAAMEAAASRVSVAYHALDLFCDVEASWSTFQETGDDEFNPSDLQKICEQFPVLLSADVEESNVLDIAAFPGARGIFVTCDDLSPRLPPERHHLPFDTIVRLLHVMDLGAGGTR
jgi:hypothetical protein